MAEFKDFEPREELEAEQIAQGIAETHRVELFKLILSDPELQEGVKAVARTLANAGISAVEWGVPLLGEAGSMGADAAKALAFMVRRLKMLDLTPDVSKKVAIGSELLEPVTLSLFPSHSLETSLQFKADVPRIVSAMKKLSTVMAGRQRELSQPQVIEAIDTFDDTKD